VSGASARDVIAQLSRRRHGVIGDTLHQTDTCGVIDVEGPGGEQQIAGRGLADERGEPPNVGPAQHDTQTCRRDPERRMWRDHTQVARHRELHASAERRAVHRCDHRGPKRHDGVEQGLERRPKAIAAAMLETADIGRAASKVSTGAERLCPPNR